jgi:hypothetical protein
VFIVEFIGILGMIAGITGIVYVIRGVVVPLIYRRKTYCLAKRLIAR